MWRGVLEIFLEIDRVVAERGLGLGARGRERERQGPPPLRATFMPRPPPPAAALTSTGKPISRAIAMRLGVGGDAAVRARHDRDAEALGGALGLDLVAHQADVLGLGPMKCTPCSARISAKRAFSDRKP